MCTRRRHTPKQREAPALLFTHFRQHVLLRQPASPAGPSTGTRPVCQCSTWCWAEAPVKIARMTLTIKLDRNWSSFQLANSAPPLSVTDSAIAPSARIHTLAYTTGMRFLNLMHAFVTPLHIATSRTLLEANCKMNECEDTCQVLHWSDLLGPESPSKIQEVTLMRPIHGNL